MARGGTVIDRLFHLTAHQTTVRTEVVAGITTFLAMAYIIFVQPAVLSAAGMDFGAVMVATCVAMQVPWQIALGAVAIAGLIFILTATVGLRERVIAVIPTSLKHAMAVGIGVLVASIGLQWGSLIVDSPGTLVTLGHLSAPATLLTLFGLAERRSERRR